MRRFIWFGVMGLGLVTAPSIKIGPRFNIPEIVFGICLLLLPFYGRRLRLPGRLWVLVGLLTLGGGAGLVLGLQNADYIAHTASSAALALVGGSPVFRVVRESATLFAIIGMLLAMAYYVRTPEDWAKLADAYMVSVLLVSAYGYYAFLSIPFKLPMLPGTEVLQVRHRSTLPEYNVVGTFMGSGLAFAFYYFRTIRPEKRFSTLAILFIFGSGLSTLSTAFVVVGVPLLVLLSAGQRRFGLLSFLIVSGAAFVLVFLEPILIFIEWMVVVKLTGFFSLDENAMQISARERVAGLHLGWDELVRSSFGGLGTGLTVFPGPFANMFLEFWLQFSIPGLLYIVAIALFMVGRLLLPGVTIELAALHLSLIPAFVLSAFITEHFYHFLWFWLMMTPRDFASWRAAQAAAAHAVTPTATAARPRPIEPLADGVTP